MDISESSQALGVHQEVMRRWVDAGLIQVVRLDKGEKVVSQAQTDRARAKMFNHLAQAALQKPKRKARASKAKKT